MTSHQSAQLKTLANANRLKIIFLLRTDEKLASQLAAPLGISFAALSRHLAMLIKYGMVSKRLERGRIYYRIGTEELMPLILAVLDFAPRRKHT